VDKYTWVDHGSSYVLSDFLAAVLKFQLDIMDEMQSKRERLFDLYRRGLSGLEQKEKLRLPIIPEYCTPNYHIFYILLPNEKERNRVMKELRDGGITAAFHYIPLHSAPYARTVLSNGISLPVTDRLSRRLLRLPLYPALTDSDVEFVVDRVIRAVA
jgi:dTDP-4-amino-4,6-dideoxygalactose transaminase